MELNKKNLIAVNDIAKIKYRWKKLKYKAPTINFLNFLAEFLIYLSIQVWFV
jgi:hypothetical protein